MRYEYVLLTLGVSWLATESIVVAAPPRQTAADRPLVTLSHEIEELPPSENAGGQKAKRSSALPTSSRSTEQRGLFPAARSYLRKLSVRDENSSLQSTEASLSEQEVVPASQSELLPIPAPESDYLPSPELVTPAIIVQPGVMAEEFAENSCAPEVHQIAPQSSRIGSRLRFPQISKLFSGSVR